MESGLYHFTERSTRYQELDLWLELHLLEEHETWCDSMNIAARTQGERESEDFFTSLKSSLQEDTKEVERDLH